MGVASSSEAGVARATPPGWRRAVLWLYVLAASNIEIVVFLLALIGFWGAWRLVALALLLPLIGTAQVLLVGDTDNSGGWVNGLHGLFAIVVVVLAGALAEGGRRSLRMIEAAPAR